MKFIFLTLLVISSVIAANCQIDFGDVEDVGTRTATEISTQVAGNEEKERGSEVEQPSDGRNRVNRHRNPMTEEVGSEALESTTGQGQGKRQRSKVSRKIGHGNGHRGRRGRGHEKSRRQLHENVDANGEDGVTRAAEEEREPKQPRWQRNMERKQQRRQQRRERRQRRKFSTTESSIGLDADEEQICAFC